MPFPVARITEALGAAGLLVESRGALPESASDITDDSRTASAGSMFIAVRGSSHDGHDFLEQASVNGAAMAIVEQPERTILPTIVVRDGRKAAAVAAAAAFEHPSRQLELAGVTGTNGKTTTVGILRHLLDAEETPAASIGTLGVLVGSAGEPMPGGAGLTTPGPVELQRVLRALADRGIRRIAMEVSSHSLDQRRVEGIVFKVGVFTNFTRDHLDYHESMESYFNAKARLISQLAPRGVAVVNSDDPAWRALPPAPAFLTFGLGPDATLRAEAISYHSRGSEWRLTDGTQRHSLQLPLIGDFNIMNTLAAAGAALQFGSTLAEIAARLRTVPQVPGRLEIIHEPPTVLRDYAHTPDALERALSAVRPFARRKLIIVFGCGGDRDRGKRPVMGAIAERMSDHVILTSDNPRTEDPDEILDDIERGMRKSNHERIEDRREAIARALSVATRPDDVILLAGKGHETYQVRGTTRHPFDEQQIVRELVRNKRAPR